MKWNDTAIVLSVRKLGESSAIIHLITPEQGMVAGIDKGASGKRKRGVYQPGNIVAAHWQARLSEHLGMFNCELVEAVAAYVLDDRRKLAALQSAAQMIEKILAEREKHTEIYDCMKMLVDALRADGNWLQAYVMLEFTLLEHAGFGLDLECCAATGQRHDLAYVSPKSGRAVSAEAGKPYHDRLFALPAFLCLPATCNLQPATSDLMQILDGVRLCGYFLENRVFAPRGAVMPAARKRFVEMLHTEERVLGQVAY